MLNRLMISLWLNRIADELDTRFGPHPMVHRSQVQQIAHELIDASTVPDKKALKAALDPVIEQAFRGGPLDK